MYEELQDQIQLEFSNQELYDRCFTHKSYLNEIEAKNGERHNERLEFLGDAVLELVTTDYLFYHYPNKNEGELTAWRSALVKGKHLSQVGRKLNLGQYLRLSKGEETSGGRDKEYLLANTLEALIGAIYLDLGYQAAKKFIDEFVLINLEQLLEEGAHKDPKSILQEHSQEEFGITPHYQLEAEVGPDHDKTFTMVAMIGERRIAAGSGSSKQKAEQAAAAQAVEEIIVESADQESPQ